MATRNTDIETYFGRCRCCLNYGYLKNMWEEHYFEGTKEVYVDMLVKCFALSWEHSAESMEHDQICESCVKRLRDAHLFKKVVLDSQEKLLGLEEADVEIEIKDKPTKAEIPIKVKQERDYSIGFKDLETDSVTESMMMVDDPDDPDYVDPDDPGIPDDASEMQYEQVEYLEDEDNKEAIAAQSEKTERSRTKATPQATADCKWPRRLPKSERYKTYKQYTEEDLRKCLDAVRKEELTTQEAAEKYNIPRKTIAAKVRQESKGSPANPDKTVNKEKMFQLIQEMKTILTYTNATPFKSKTNRYYCAYCFADGPYYEDADDLRTHTRTHHVTDRTQKIEYAMRPHWMNETVKVDIDNLLCVVCCLPISTWNEMFKHLKDQHKIVLDQAYTRAIPYVLKSDINCALCKEPFSNFMQIDGHMNAHYNNYVCDDCGDTFLSANRLKQHMKIHDVGRFACGICPKVFTLEKYRKKHEELVHKHLSKFKCWYCDERFPGEYLRHVHIVEKHKEKVKIIACEFCGKTFTWRPYYITHKRKAHSEDASPFKCTECDKTFFLQFQLKEHMLRHTGQKHFPCDICGKRYVSSGSLKHHRNWHKRNEEMAREAAILATESLTSDSVVASDKVVSDVVGNDSVMNATLDESDDMVVIEIQPASDAVVTSDVAVSDVVASNRDVANKDAASIKDA